MKKVISLLFIATTLAAPFAQAECLLKKMSKSTSRFDQSSNFYAVELKKSKAPMHEDAGPGYQVNKRN